MNCVNQELRDLIQGYFIKYPNMSINGLAKKSGVPATTLRRITAESTKTLPAPHTILNIVSSVYKEKRLGKLLNIVDGQVGKILRDSFSTYIYEDAKHVVELDLNYYLKDRNAYFIYKLAANRIGTTRLEVVELLGQLGYQKLEELIDLGWVEENDERIHAKEKNYSLDIGVAKKHLPELVSFYKPEQVSKGLNIFYTLSESLNREGVQKIKDIQREAVKKIHEVVSDLKYAGEIPYFTVNLADTLSLAGGEVSAGDLQ